MLINRHTNGFEQLQAALQRTEPDQVKSLTQEERKVCKKVLELMNSPKKEAVQLKSKEAPDLEAIATKLSKQVESYKPSGTGERIRKGIANIFGTRISSQSLLKDIQ